MGAGAMAAFAFDLLLRYKSRNKDNLDSFMVALYKENGQPGKPIDWDTVRQLAQRIAGSDGADFFDTYLRGVNPLPMDSFLEYAGLDMQYVDADRKDEGEEKEAKAGPYEPNPKVTLGIETDEEQGGALFVADVRRDGPGWKAGLDFGDEILAINQRRVNKENFEKVLGWSRPGDEVEVLVSRTNRILRLQVVLDARPRKLKLVPDPDASNLQKRIFADLFRIPKTTPNPGETPNGNN